MILLKNTNETIEIVTSSTAGIDFSVSWVDVTTTTFTPSTTEGKITTATTTTITAAPAASTQRQIKLITLRNIHASTSNTICVQKDTAGTKYKLTPEVILLAGEVLQYVDSNGWIYYSSTGAVLTNIGNLTGHITSVGTATLLGSFTSAQLATALTDETGSGANVFANTPTLITPLLGTPTSGDLANCTGLPVAGGGTGASTFTDAGVLIGNNSGAIQVTTAGTSGQVLTSNGTGVDPTFQAASGGGITIGSTAITSGTTTRILYNNAGVVGEYTLTGTGTVNVMQTSPTFVTDIISPLVIGGTGTTQTLTLQTTSGAGTTGSDIIFKDNNTEFMRILNNGRVGIGASDPSAPLHIAGTPSANQGMLWIASTSSPHYIVFSQPGTQDLGAIGFDSSARMNFITGGHLAGGVIRMTILSGGRIGIGEIAPTAVLHLKASTATANTASLKIDAGTVATTPVSGNIESDGTNLYWTDSGGTRRQLNN